MAVGDIPTAFGMSPAISYVIGAAILFSLLRFYGKKDFDSPQWADQGDPTR
jgi:hypothetical protein